MSDQFSNRHQEYAGAVNGTERALCGGWMNDLQMKDEYCAPHPLCINFSELAFF